MLSFFHHLEGDDYLSDWGFPENSPYLSLRFYAPEQRLRYIKHLNTAFAGDHAIRDHNSAERTTNRNLFRTSGNSFINSI
jgi:hypothetical protein